MANNNSDISNRSLKTKLYNRFLEAKSLMRPHIQKIIELLGKFEDNIYLASLFGSCAKDCENAHSDIDLLIVCDKTVTPQIYQHLRKLDLKLKRNIHINIYAKDIFNKRIKRRDYLITSLLQDSIPILGDERFEELKNDILKIKLDHYSLKFNRNIGIKLFTRASRTLFSLTREKTFTSHCVYNELFKKKLLRSLEDLHVALGYLYASEKMKQSGKIVTFNNLLRSESTMFKEVLYKRNFLKRTQLSPNWNSAILDTIANLASSAIKEISQIKRPPLILER